MEQCLFYSDVPRVRHTVQIGKESYKMHPKFRVVPHFSKFDLKIDHVLQFCRDALDIDGLIGDRTRSAAKLDAALIPAEFKSDMRGFLVTTVFLDESHSRSVRRRQESSVAAWFSALDSLKQGKDFEFNESMFTDVTYEKRDKVKPTNAAAEEYETRNVIKSEQWNDIILSSGQRASYNYKYVLSFLLEKRYYEIYFWGASDSNLQTIVDYESDADLSKLPFLKLSSEGVTRPNSDSPRRSSLGSVASAKKNLVAARLKVTGDQHPTPSKQDGADIIDQKAKKPRGLKRHATEDAARAYNIAAIAKKLNIDGASK